MSSNTILECSQKDASSTVSNANWTNTFQNEYSVEEGDVIQMKMCLINTQNVTSTNIVLAEDQDISITYCVYENAFKENQIPFNTQDPTYGATTSGNTDPNFQFTNEMIYRSGIETPTPANNVGVEGLYIQRAGATTNSALLTYDINFTIPAGSYSPDTIASKITDALKSQIVEIDGNTIQIGTIIKTSQQKDFVNILAGLNTGPPDSYKTKNVLVVKNKKDANPAERFATMFRLTGASNALFEFKDGSFQFSFLHTPVFTESRNVGTDTNKIFSYSTPGVALSLQPDNNANTAKDSFGGIMFTSLEPKTFWNNLGFTDSRLNEILYDDTTMKATAANLRTSYVEQRTTGVDTNASFERSSGSSVPFTAMVPNSSSGSNPDTQMFPLVEPFATTELRVLKASQPYSVDNIGFYRVEAIANFENDYQTPDTRKGHVAAVVSKQYQQNDFVTAFGSDSSLTYQHIGETTLLNSLNIRVIDPETEQEVDNLGTKSTVFMELIKAPPQPEKKSKDKS